MTRYLWIFAVPALAAAQIATVQMAAPTLGYVWDQPTFSLRPLEGVPGSATVGHPINLETSLQRVWVGPGRRYGLGIAPDASTLTLLRLDGSVGVSRGTSLPAAAVSFSPSGETIALLRGNQVEVWRGLPDHATQTGLYNTGDLAVDRAFVSDDGSMVLALASGSLHRLSTDASPERIGGSYRDLAFLRNTQDLIAVEGSGAIVMLRKASSEFTEALATVEGAAGIALSGDERFAAVLIDGGSLVLLNRETRKVTEHSLDGITLDSVLRAEGNAVFQVAASTDNDIWLLDADSGTPLLVPVSKGEIQ